MTVPYPATYLVCRLVLLRDQYPSPLVSLTLSLQAYPLTVALRPAKVIAFGCKVGSPITESHWIECHPLRVTVLPVPQGVTVSG